MTAYYQKPEIFLGLETNRHHLIEASAGTGKTYTIEHLVIELLLRGTRLEEILLVTFTEKATRELKARIREKLHQLLALQDGTGADLPAELCWAIDARARPLLERALLDFDNASIFTIHGFCHQVLRDFAFENGQPFDLEKINLKPLFGTLFQLFLRRMVLVEGAPLRKQILSLSWRGNAQERGGLSRRVFGLPDNLADLVFKKGRLLPDLEEARQAVDAWRRSLQQKDLTQELARLNRNKRTVEKMVATFTRLRAEALEGDWTTVLVRTREWKLDSFLKPDSWRFNKPKKEKINAIGEISSDLHDFLEHSEAVARNACSPESQLQLQLLPHLREFLRAEMRERDWIDFDDMIRLVAESLASDSGPSPLAEALRARYRYAVIDEFQDTDEDQWSIFSNLFLDTGRHTLFLIGDPKQAIYGFRGADVYTYLAAKQKIAEKGGRIARLDANYRASAAMTEAVNAVFTSRHLFRENPREGTGITYEPVRCGNPKNRLTGDQGPALYGLVLYPEEGREEIKAQEAREGFAHWIADHIEAFQRSGYQVPDKQGGSRPTRHDDIAVLTRSHTEAGSLGTILSQRGIPFTIYKQTGLFQTKEAQDLYQVLQAVQNWREDAAGFRALLTDFFQVDLEVLLRGPVFPESLREWFCEWHKLAYHNRDYRRLFYQIFAKTEVLQRLLPLEDGERRVTNYEHIADILKREGANLDLRQLLQRFRRYLEGELDPESNRLHLETDRPAVQVMTIHAAKGLEFSVVFVFGGLTGGGTGKSGYHEFHHPRWGKVIDLGKNHKEQHARAQREESERLYYVALTRARYKLFLPVLPLIDGRECMRLTPGESYGVMMSSIRELRERAQLPFLHFEERRFTPPRPLEPASKAREETCRTSLEEPSVPIDFERIKREKSRFKMTSYTRLMYQNQPISGLQADSDRESRRFDEAPDSEEPELIPLPKGREAGICLHQILELTPQLWLADYPGEAFAAWREDARVRLLIRKQLACFNLDSYYGVAADIVWRALNTQVLEDIRIGRLPERDRCHEVEFHYPLQRLEGGTTMLTGSIDLAFRGAGRYYFGDWKSDTLADYSIPALAAKVEEHYQTQIQIYLWAMLRWLGINGPEGYERDFGGLFYWFVRGMAPGKGTYFFRPSWEEARRYLADLLQDL